MKAFLRWFLPDTLVGRTVVVLLVGLLLSQVAGVILYSMSRMELVNRLSSEGAEHIAGVVKVFEATPEADRHRIIRAMERPGLRIGWDRNPLIATGDGEYSGLSVIQDELNKRLPGYEMHVSMGRLPPMPPSDMDGRLDHRMAHGPEPLPDFHFDHQPSSPPGEGFESPPAPGIGPGRRPHPPVVAVHLPDGGWLNFVADVPFEEPLLRPRFFGPLTGGLLVVMVLSVLAVRRAAKPLALLAAAAQRLGRDVNAPQMPLSGPREVRAAALAFNEMQTRLRRFVEDRTQMVAAISHDLRTPITRLKLRAEFVDDDEQRVKMLSDLDEMEAMISSTLAFARDDATREKRRPFDFALTLAELCVEFDAGYEGPESLTVTAGLSGFKRTFANLLDNARKYGCDVQVVLASDAGMVTVRVMDAGPGIPEAEMDRVFAPFYRVESSRNRDTGGTGLGLSVARSVIRAHGGDITLANRPEGGLCVTVVFPA
ncbi:sensor histidine kinase [Telmatospirillum siberiense]|uniref:histidine kinase n=1 Tax=Telmatospirillum siberiense TaxID=382514 RepID=A0A2N3PQD4_9PROT|nr:HAMP domain-containing sensor histidine kinase [Telmatospirillum siberiense]PKU22607.1 two-component sensor histidine kinase [Telmatospirillum siberiense]